MMMTTLAEMQQAKSPTEAERLRWNLERQFVPNQVLGDGAEELASLIFSGLSDATNAGQVESWNLLAQLAAGAVGPTAANEDIIAATQRALLDRSDSVVDQVTEGAQEDCVFLALDVLDAMLEFAPQGARGALVDAVKVFAARGPREDRRAQVILRSGNGF